MMKVLLSFICIFLVSPYDQLSNAKADEVYQFEHRLKAMIDHGVIEKDEANKQISEIKSHSQSQFHHQVRGVASKIKEVKVYEIINEPLEILSD